MHCSRVRLDWDADKKKSHFQLGNANIHTIKYEYFRQQSRKNIKEVPLFDQLITTDGHVLGSRIHS